MKAVRDFQEINRMCPLLLRLLPPEPRMAAGEINEVVLLLNASDTAPRRIKVQLVHFIIGTVGPDTTAE